MFIKLFLILFITSQSLITPAFAGTDAEGLAFLANKEREAGVVKLPSGLLYKEIRAGTWVITIFFNNHFSYDHQLNAFSTSSDILCFVTVISHYISLIMVGSGRQPAIDSPCEIHFSGKLLDGREFESSYKMGLTTLYAPQQLIAGFKEALLLMKEGSMWELYIPSELAYGDRGAGGTLFGHIPYCVSHFKWFFIIAIWHAECFELLT